MSKKLLRSLGVPEAFSSGYSDVASSAYFSIAIVTLYAGYYTPIIYLIASIPFLAVALSYAELSSSYPEPGASFIYVRKALGPFFAIIASIGLLLDYSITLGYSVIAITGYLDGISPISQIINRIDFVYFSLIILLIIITLTSLGIREVGNMLKVMMILDLSLMAIIIITGLPFYIYKVRVNGFAFVKDANYAFSLAFSSYIGIEATAQVAGEVKKPRINMGRAIILVYVLATIYSSLLSASGIGLLGENIVNEIRDPVTAIASEVPFIGYILKPYSVFVATTIFVSSSMAAIIGASRLLYSMSERNVIPMFISRLNRFKSPYVANIALMISTIPVVVINEPEVTLNLYLFGTMSAYILTLIAQIILRIKERKLSRPFKVPINIRVNKYEISLIPIFGVFLILFALYETAVQRPLSLSALIVVIVISVVIYYNFSRRKKSFKSL
jgi:APA family basic amino acid/polyamine antiporter